MAPPRHEQRQVKIVTEQHNIDKPPLQEGFPMKEWTIKLYLLDTSGNEVQANCFNRVTYNLHESFANPHQTFSEPPFVCTNEGWGEFEMTLDCYYTDKTKITVRHDLNFQSPTYDNIQTITFKNPSRDLQAVLRTSGPLPTDEKRKADGAGGAGGKRKKPFDVEKVADGLVKLSEDDLLKVIQLIHDNKSDDTFVQNNTDAGEFSVDLYTIPDSLGVMLEQFLAQHLDGGY